MIRRKHKYGAKPTVVDGVRFASKGEAGRYVQLKQLVAAGVIEDLVLQPRYPLHVSGVKVCEYRPDFQYREDGALVVEDFKGTTTAVFTLKARMFRAEYPLITFRIVTR